MDYVTVGDVEVPALGLGTYRLRGAACAETVREALELGYRHVDTAEFYDNQEAVGRGVADAPVEREEIFLTTKVWRSNLAHDQVLRSARESLSKLGLAYVDLLLIHWPSRTVPVAETLDAMTRLRDEGTVRHVGVSNFTVSQLQEARRVSDVPILTDQVEYHPFTGQSALLEYCIEHDVALTAYSPLVTGQVAGDETLAAIPKAASREHLRANIDVFDFTLTDEEMRRVFDLGEGLVSTLRRRLGLQR